MNLPNWITVSRLFLTVACFAVLASLRSLGDGAVSTWAWIAFALFVVAAATDYVDGYLARKLGQVTAFGRIADPFADKVLICGTFIMLLEFDALRVLLPAWIVVVVVGRELLVTALRGYAESVGVAFPAERLGKLKMVAQAVTAGALLTLLAGTETFRPVAEWGVWVTLLLTLISGFGYVRKARPLLFAERE